MNRKGVSILFAIIVGALAGPGFESPKASQKAYQGPTGIPPYHNTDPEKELPAVLPASQFTGDAQRAYSAAARAGKVLYQQPCYCYCNLDKGHKSLHECFTSTHGSTCSICQREAIYADEQIQAGKSPKQIRKEIIAGK